MLHFETDVGQREEGHRYTECREQTVKFCRDGFVLKNKDSKTAERHCVECSFGSFKAGINAETSCTPQSELLCGPGEFLQNAASTVVRQSCAACDQGFFKSGTNADESCRRQTVTTCAAGQFLENQGSKLRAQVCTTCPTGTFVAEDGGAPSRCIDHSTASCAPGDYLAIVPSTIEDGLCDECRPGTYQPSSGNIFGLESCKQWEVTLCPSNKYMNVEPSAITDGECGDCASGSYVTANGCVPHGTTSCPAGSFMAQSPGPTQDGACSECPDGEFSISTNTAAACMAHAVVGCRAGEFMLNQGSKQKQQKCSQCAPGQYRTTPAGELHTEASCVSHTHGVTCGPGEYLVNRASRIADLTCRECPFGKYKIGTNSNTECLAQEVGLSNCILGQYLVNQGSRTAKQDCVACLNGQYGAEPGVCIDHEVTSCAPGYFMETIPSLLADGSCSRCDAGKYQPVAGNTFGAESCLDHVLTKCPVGFYLTTFPSRLSDGKCDNCPVVDGPLNCRLASFVFDHSFDDVWASPVNKARFENALLAVYDGATAVERLERGSIIATLLFSKSAKAVSADALVRACDRRACISFDGMVLCPRAPDRAACPPPTVKPTEAPTAAITTSPSDLVVERPGDDGSSDGSSGNASSGSNGSITIVIVVVVVVVLLLLILMVVVVIIKKKRSKGELGSTSTQTPSAPRNSLTLTPHSPNMIENPSFEVDLRNTSVGGSLERPKSYVSIDPLKGPVINFPSGSGSNPDDSEPKPGGYFAQRNRLSFSESGDIRVVSLRRKNPMLDAGGLAMEASVWEDEAEDSIGEIPISRTNSYDEALESDEETLDPPGRGRSYLKIISDIPARPRAASDFAVPLDIDTANTIQRQRGDKVVVVAGSDPETATSRQTNPRPAPRRQREAKQPPLSLAVVNKPSAAKRPPLSPLAPKKPPLSSNSLLGATPATNPPLSPKPAKKSPKTSPRASPQSKPQASPVPAPRSGGLNHERRSPPRTTETFVFPSGISITIGAYCPESLSRAEREAALRAGQPYLRKFLLCSGVPAKHGAGAIVHSELGNDGITVGHNVIQPVQTGDGGFKFESDTYLSVDSIIDKCWSRVGAAIEIRAESPVPPLASELLSGQPKFESTKAAAIPELNSFSGAEPGDALVGSAVSGPPANLVDYRENVGLSTFPGAEIEDEAALADRDAVWMGESIDF